MKRLLQGLAILQVLLLLGLGTRVVEVLRTPMPEFPEVPELPALTPLPPPRERPKVTPNITDAIVDADLFDEVRGQGGEDIDVSDVVVDAAPVAPPTSVTLAGVMLLGQEPVAILSDTTVGPGQASVRPGDMFGEYEVGDITSSAVILLGSSGQEFQVPLRVGAAGGDGGAAPVPPPAARGAAATAARPGAAARPTANRPGDPRQNDAKDSRTMTARERAQAISQRNAEIRDRAQAQGGEEDGEEKGSAPDPVQARLEALRQLREAAKNR